MWCKGTGLVVDKKSGDEMRFDLIRFDAIPTAMRRRAEMREGADGAGAMQKQIIAPLIRIHGQLPAFALSRSPLALLASRKRLVSMIQPTHV